MVLEHLSSGMTLRDRMWDIVLGVPQHPVPAKAVLKPGLGPVYPLVSGSLNVVAQPEDFLPDIPGDHQKQLLSLLPRLFPEDFVIIQEKQVPVDVIILHCRAGVEQLPLLRLHLPSPAKQK